MEPIEITAAEAREEKRKKRKDFLINLAFALGGAGISVGSFFLFRFFPTKHFLTVIVSIFGVAFLKNEFTNSFFLYPIFLMPAFVIEIIVLWLVVEGISYA